LKKKEESSLAHDLWPYPLLLDQLLLLLKPVYLWVKVVVVVVVPCLLGCLLGVL
jgi:hypothetical protein